MSREDDEERAFAHAARKLLFRKNPSADTSPAPTNATAAGAVGRHVRVKVTMNIDGDILHFFKERAKTEGRPYQLLINDALRDALDRTNVGKVAREVGQLLADDPGFVDAIKKQLKD